MHVLICSYVGYVNRDSAPNRSVVVMKFRDPANAAEFVEAYNGKQFNSMEVRGISVSLFFAKQPH